MIYTIASIITLAILAILFREEFTDSTYEYLAMICIGAMIWPATIVWFIILFFDWRRG